MKTMITLICVLLTASFSPLQAGSSTFVDYQNYDHGYCPDCNCSPCKCNQGEEEAGEEEEEPEPSCSTCAPKAPAPAPAAPCQPCNKPEPCDPAPVCATNCGVNLCWIGLGIALIATAGAIIVSANNGSRPSH